MKLKLITILALLFLLTSCSKQFVCPEGTTKVMEECCKDLNDNEVCDSDEPGKTITVEIDHSEVGEATEIETNGTKTYIIDEDEKTRMKTYEIGEDGPSKEELEKMFLAKQRQIQKQREYEALKSNWDKDRRCQELEENEQTDDYFYITECVEEV